ncbi:hypothetical protein N0V82_003119 [Gnomoniopsis sp. IMI 355080]|nr:hypothetical protein N0V82_003119 [Gnomoniopsis sp. IMI 355080]
MATPTVQNLKEKNEAYASNFKHGDLPLPPAKKYLVVTCMDARIIPSTAFGIDIGDAHVIRNAGGSARDALRSILISQQLLGTREILLVKHTGCGMLTFTNEDAHALVSQTLGGTAAAEIATLDFLPFANVEEAVKEDLAFLKKQSAVPKDIAISGWVYEVETGKVRQIE